MWREELEMFLCGTFHQDIESPDTALLEYSIECKETLDDIITAIEEFLATSITYEEKNEFIAQNAEIYFPFLNKEPIEWLKEVKKILQSKKTDN